MQKVSKRHHYVSRGYLQRFTDSGDAKGKLWVFDLRENKWFTAKPRGVALETDFNKIDVPGYAPDYLEQKFADELEGKALSVLRTICSLGAIPPDEDFSYVLNLITLFAVRNPVMRRSMTAAMEHTNRLIADLLASDRGLYEYQIRKAREAGSIPGPVVPFERIRDLPSIDFDLQVTPHQHLARELRAFPRILETVSGRHWSLLIATPDAPDFITCDHPVSLVYKQCVFPIGPRHALMGDREAPAPAVITVSPDGVAEVNARIASLADRQIYAGSSAVTILVDGEVVRMAFSQLESARFSFGHSRR